MNICKLAESVWEASEFLTEQELDLLMSLTKNYEGEGWNHSAGGKHWANRVLMVKENSADPILAHEFMKNLERRVESMFLEYSEIHDMSSIIRYRPGDYMDVHRDNVEKSDHDNMYGVVIYLNDNYEGGEIYYPSIGLKVKPKANSIVIHAAGLDHGVHEVTSGIRYVVTTFVRGSLRTSVREK